MQKVARALVDQVQQLDLILTSPYIRAKQTAQILSEFYPQTRVSIVSDLVPESPAPAVIKWIKAHCKEAHQILLVGHEPHLSSLICYLLAGTERSFVEMKKSAVCCLQIDDPEILGANCATLEWLAPPKIILN